MHVSGNEQEQAGHSAAMNAELLIPACARVIIQPTLRTY
jgi:hypothetical protein